MSGASSTASSSPPTAPPSTGPRGPQRRRTSGLKVGLVVLVVVIVIGGSFAYLYVNHKLPSLGKGVACSGACISVWQDFSPYEFPAFYKAVHEFENQTHYQVSWVNQTSPSPSGYVTAAVAGDAPDILIGSSDFAGGLWFDGYLANLSKLLPSSAFTPFVPEALTDNTQAGTIYGIPLNVNGVAMIYNKQLIPTAPTTTDQMVSEAENITTYSGGTVQTAGVIYGLESDGGYRFPAWQSGFGGQMFLPNGVPDLNTSQTVNALTFLNNFTTTYKIEPVGITTESDYESAFAEGKAGIIFDGPWDIQEYISALGAQNVGVAPMPIVSQTGLHPRPLWGSIGAYVSVPAASGANATIFNESVKFAQFLASDEFELSLFNKSADIPSLSSVFDKVEALGNPIVNGFLDQFFNYSQPFPNTEPMTYYWTPYTTYVSGYVAGSIDAATAVSDINTTIVQEMQSNSIPPY